MATEYESWIKDSNLRPTLVAIGWICGYDFDQDDWDAVSSEMKASLKKDSPCFVYPLAGKFEIKVELEIEEGDSVYTIRTSSPRNVTECLELVVLVAQTYRLES